MIDVWTKEDLVEWLKDRIAWLGSNEDVAAGLISPWSYWADARSFVLAQGLAKDLDALGSEPPNVAMAHPDTYRLLCRQVKVDFEKLLSRLGNKVACEADIPPEYRDGGKPDGEPLTVAYVERLDKYNLKGPFLSKQGLETIKYGRADVYLFVDIAPLSASRNLADDENEGH